MNGPRLEAALLMGLFAARQGKALERVLDPDELAGVLRGLDALTREHGTGGQAGAADEPTRGCAWVSGACWSRCCPRSR